MSEAVSTTHNPSSLLIELAFAVAACDYEAAAKAQRGLRLLGWEVGRETKTTKRKTPRTQKNRSDPAALEYGPAAPRSLRIN